MSLLALYRGEEDVMALIDCGECGRGVSDRAAACPHCGHPIGGAAASNPAIVTVQKNAHPVLTFLGGVVVVVFVLAAIGAVMEGREERQKGASKPGGVRQIPAARFVVADVLMDENCTQLGDYCVSVHCTYQNVGEVAGAKRVRADLFQQSGGRVATHDSNLTLLPGATQRVTFNFMEATLDDASYRAQCDVGATGSGSGAV
jgi:hypothetical protein